MKKDQRKKYKATQMFYYKNEKILQINSSFNLFEKDVKKFSNATLKEFFYDIGEENVGNLLLDLAQELWEIKKLNLLEIMKEKGLEDFSLKTIMLIDGV